MLTEELIIWLVLIENMRIANEELVFCCFDILDLCSASGYLSTNMENKNIRTIRDRGENPP